MPGWMTQVTYTQDPVTTYLIPQYSSALIVQNAVKAIHRPYKLLGRTLSVFEWSSVIREIKLQGSSSVWILLNVDDPGASIDGASWFPDVIPVWRSLDERPLIQDTVYLAAMYNALLAIHSLGQQDGVGWMEELARSMPFLQRIQDTLIDVALTVGSRLANYIGSEK
jgi:hypothetical protein